MDLSDTWTARQEPARRVTSVDFVLRDLQDAISAGVLQVGERLPSEAALAARYSVSRSVVREVLRACEAKGLTITRTGKGTFVVAERPRELVFEGFSAETLMEARPHIEVPAAALAAIRRTEDHLETLQGLVEAMEQPASATDDAVWTGLDSTFHLTVAAASGNPVFVIVLVSIKDALAGQSGLLNQRPHRREASNLEHRSIVAAIARSSSAEAEDAMRYHLDEVKEALASTLHASP